MLTSNTIVMSTPLSPSPPPFPPTNQCPAPAVASSIRCCSSDAVTSTSFTPSRGTPDTVATASTNAFSTAASNVPRNFSSVIHARTKSGTGGTCRVGASDGGADGRALGDADGDALGTVVGRALGDAVGDADGRALGDRDGAALGAADGAVLGDHEGDAEGSSLGENVGDAEGEALGNDVGLRDGDGVGDAVGDVLGDVVGIGVGEALGLSLGLDDGLCEGLAVGRSVPHRPSMFLITGPDGYGVGYMVGSLEEGYSVGAIVVRQKSRPGGHRLPSPQTYANPTFTRQCKLSAQSLSSSQSPSWSWHGHASVQYPLSPLTPMWQEETCVITHDDWPLVVWNHFPGQVLHMLLPARSWNFPALHALQFADACDAWSW